MTAGRRHEFRHFSAFADPERRQAIPDPQAEATFRQEHLELGRARPGRDTCTSLRLYESLLALRRTLVPVEAGAVDAAALDEHSLALARTSREGDTLTLVVYLAMAGRFPVPGRRSGATARCTFNTEDPAFAQDPRPIALETHENAVRLTFHRPGAFVLADDR